MRFFEDTNGGQRPVASIARIGKIQNRSGGSKEAYYPVSMSDGSSCEIDDWQFRKLMDAPIHFIPAAPDTYMLHPPGEPGEEREEPWRTPIIGWGINAVHQVYPYTADGQDDGLSNAGPILFPNGFVVEQHSQCWRTEADWIEHYRAEHDKKQA